MTLRRTLVKRGRNDITNTAAVTGKEDPTDESMDALITQNHRHSQLMIVVSDKIDTDEDTSTVGHIRILPLVIQSVVSHGPTTVLGNIIGQSDGTIKSDLHHFHDQKRQLP